MMPLSAEKITELERAHWGGQRFNVSAFARAIEKEVREDCAELVESNQYLSGGPGPLYGAGWNEALKACAAILRRQPGSNSHA